MDKVKVVDIAQEVLDALRECDGFGSWAEAVGVHNVRRVVEEAVTKALGSATPEPKAEESPVEVARKALVQIARGTGIVCSAGERIEAAKVLLGVG